MIEIFKTDKIPSDFLEAIRLSMNYGYISKLRLWKKPAARVNPTRECRPNGLANDGQ